jgi:hypothetical protein
MEDPATTTLSQETSPKETLGRRQLLKAIAATGGAVAASTFLPGEWAKPIVEVGVLPAHAQVSEKAGNPAVYVALCDSTPGGGNIVATPTITNIRPYVQLLSGSGSLEGISVTMTVNVISGSPSFSYAFPQSSTTNSSGRASFPNLGVSGTNGDRFRLIFSFAVPDSSVPAVADCGEFFIAD